MRPLLLAVMLAGMLLPALAPVRAQNSPQIAINNADWTATDDLGRTLPTYAQVGPPKPHRWVGLFYWLWHGPDRWGLNYDVTKFLKTHPGFRDFQAYPPGGPNDPTWYWAEPLFGYYRSTDPWVIRKHLILFADAGVDFLFLDYTNAAIYDPELKTLLAVAEDLKAQGVAVPRLVFFLNFQPEWKIEALYKEWYKPGQYDDMWFRWQGKPLLMAPMPTDAAKLKDPSLLPAMQRYFTWRPTWAFQDAAKEPTKWRFMDEFYQGKAQRPALGPDGRVEQMVVSKSLGGPIWENMKTGGVSSYPGHVPVYNDQWVSPDAPKGLFFQHQWDNALRVGAPILLVTGWNEWTASVWETPGVKFLGRVTQKGQGHIVDEFNRDFNRDLEPMRGGYRDNYLWQFVADMRRYKGMKAPQTASAPKTIRLDGPWSQWDGVRPIYRDAQGDTADRDWDGAAPHTHYVNRSARNDIIMAQVARDRSTLYFHVRTAAPLTPATDKSWMWLLVDADAGAKTGWHGYDFLINRRRDGNRCTVERNVGGEWRWRPVADVPMHWAGRDLEIAVPRALLGLSPTRGPLRVDFKWADNLPARPDIMDFYSQGDVAPDARFNYRFAPQVTPFCP
ncbi:MAG: hypothetical protein JO250_01370 [Armatimonadetes bacterium]|nr:hypothetical protein [Armatimonadota bacterium]